MCTEFSKSYDNSKFSVLSKACNLYRFNVENICFLILLRRSCVNKD